MTPPLHLAISGAHKSTSVTCGFEVVIFQRLLHLLVERRGPTSKRRNINRENHPSPWPRSEIDCDNKKGTGELGPGIIQDKVDRVVSRMMSAARVKHHRNDESVTSWEEIFCEELVKEGFSENILNKNKVRGSLPTWRECSILASRKTFRPLPSLKINVC